MRHLCGSDSLHTIPTGSIKRRNCLDNVSSGGGSLISACQKPSSWASLAELRRPQGKAKMAFPSSHRQSGQSKKPTEYLRKAGFDLDSEYSRDGIECPTSILGFCGCHTFVPIMPTTAATDLTRSQLDAPMSLLRLSAGRQSSRRQSPPKSWNARTLLYFRLKTPQDPVRLSLQDVQDDKPFRGNGNANLILAIRACFGCIALVRKKVRDDRLSSRNDFNDRMSHVVNQIRDND